MNSPATPANDAPAELTCGNCQHTFKQNHTHEAVVCVPHLKTVPVEQTEVCELHRPKPKKP